jgi:hypothetical protein
MHAFTKLAPRQSKPIVSVARRNRRRRLYFRLRNFGRAAASGMTGIWTGLLKALHDSRSRLAVRVIDQHRHLVGGCRPMSAAPCADARVARCGKPTAGSNDIMWWRPNFLLAVLMIVFAFAHLLALQKLNAMQSERLPGTIDLLAD